MRAVISAASRSMIGPSLSVVQTVPSRRRKLAPALSSPPKQHEPSNRPGANHLKPTGTSDSRRPSLLHDAVDHAAADQRLADRGLRRPVGPVRQQIVGSRPPGSGSGFISPARRRDDAVPVGVGVVGERDPVAVLEADEPGHRVGARAVHADLAVVVDRHEREGRIDLRIDDRDVEAVDRVDRLPVVHAPRRRADRRRASGRAARIASMSMTLPQIVDIGQDEIVLVRRLPRLMAAANGMRFTPALPPRSSSLARSWIHLRHVGVGRAAVGRVVLEAAVLRRIVRGRDDDAVGEVLACGRGCRRGWRAR